MLVGLFAVIISVVVNIFLKSDTFSLILSFVTVIIFIVLTAYDTQKIKYFYLQSASTGSNEMASKYAIISALELYLDFINIFLSLLRIFGRKR